MTFTAVKGSIGYPFLIIRISLTVLSMVVLNILSIPLSSEGVEHPITDPTLSGPFTLIINEVYPDSDIDINEDGSIDQEDEFVELYNPNYDDHIISGYSISDNTRTYYLLNETIAARSRLMLGRWDTGLALGRDDLITLKDENGSVLDTFEFQGAGKGESFQRAPDGAQRWTSGADPTPGSTNTLPPTFLLNEVFPDPEGSNSGNQWVEVLNKGPPWDINDFILTNHDSVNWELPSYRVLTGERFIVLLGPEDGSFDVPENTLVVSRMDPVTMYSSGDDIELIDGDGYSLDLLAWGNSTHVDRSTGIGPLGAWSGKFYDNGNSSMSKEGTENIQPVEGFSIMRVPDGVDTDSPWDLSFGPSITGSTPGWNNSIDPGMVLVIPDGPMDISEGGSAQIEMNIAPSGNMMGNISLTIIVKDLNWTCSLLSDILQITSDNTVANLSITFEAPGDLRVSNHCEIIIDLFWEDLPFLHFREQMDLRIPSFDVGLEDVEVSLDGFGSEVFPEGSYIEIQGRVVCSGEIPGGDSLLTFSLVEENDPDGLVVITDSMEFKDLKASSKRTFSRSLDTYGLEGNYTLTLRIDEGDRIREPDEENNLWIMELSIIPTIPEDEMEDLVVTKVLWNISREGTFVEIMNTGNQVIELSSMRLYFDDDWVSFPDEALLPPGSKTIIAGGEEAIEINVGLQQIYRMDTAGPVNMRMKMGEATPDIQASSLLRLMTEFRDLLDEVVLKRSYIEEMNSTGPYTSFPETTLGSILYRRIGNKGDYIDTDTPLDWTVEPVHAHISTLLIDPGPNGPGEFIGITPEPEENDISGLGIFRGEESIVIPYDYQLTYGECIISKEPSAFSRYQLKDPDLAFQDTFEGIPGCGVPGFRAISLPNSGSEIILVDRGNRVIETVVWGNMGGPDPGLGNIITRSVHNGSIGSWRLVGTGSLPLTGNWSISENSTIRTGTGALPDLENSENIGEVLVILPGITVESLAGKILDLREEGNLVHLYLTLPPWNRDDGFQSFDMGGRELSWLRYLEKTGIGIHALEKGQEEWTSGCIITDSYILSFNVPRTGKTEDVKWALIENGTSGSRVGSFFTDLLEIEDWFDASLVLGDAEPIRPTVALNGPIGHCWVRSGSTSVSWSLDPSLHIGKSERVTIKHVSGPLDTSTILELLMKGSSVELFISPSICNVQNIEGLLSMEKERSRLSQEPPSHLLEELDEGVLGKLKVLIERSDEMDLDLKVSMLKTNHTCNDGSNIWSWDDGYAFTLATGLSSPVSCWFIGTDLSEAGSDCSEPFTDLIGTQLPLSLLPLDEKDLDPTPGILIERIYPDTYLKDDPDEAICLLNCKGSPMDISGFILTDDEGDGRESDGMIIIPEGTIIGPGERSWISRDRGRFRFQFGFEPDLTLYNGTPETTVQIAYGDLRLANSNDTIALRDPCGKIVDVVPYGGSTWDGVWPCYMGGYWSGPSVPQPGWGKILYRWRNWDENSPEDTDTANDLLSMRPLYPGQSDIPEMYSPVTGSAEAGICPDSGWRILRDAIKDSSSRILLNVYEMTSDWVVSSLIGARERGLDVKVLLEGGPVGGTSYTSEVLADRLTSNGVDVRWMLNDIGSDVRDRYRYDHAKYIVIDGKTTLVSTDNLKDTSFPRNGIGVIGTRGWIVSVSSVELAEKMEKIFIDDWEGMDMFENLVDHDNLEDISTIGSKSEILEVEDPKFPSMITKEAVSVSLLACPDHISTPGNPLIRSIIESESSIDLELMDIDTDFDLQGISSPVDLLKVWGVEEPIPGFNNPYLAALFDAARRGVKVRLLLDGSDFDGDGIPENRWTAERIEQAILENGLSGSFQVRLHPIVRTERDSEISLVHAKGMVIDKKTTWISSFNWGPTSGLENREMGLLIGSQEIGQYFTSVIEHDWGGTLQDELSIEIRQVRFTHNDGSDPIVRIGLDVNWEGVDNLELTLRKKDTQGDIILLKEIGPGFDEILLEEFPLYNVSEGEVLVVFAQSKDRTLELFELTVEFNEIDTSESSPGMITSTMAPIILIVLFTLSISIARMLVVETRIRFKKMGQSYEE